MQIEGSFVVAAPIDVVWTYITNPDVVAPCVPGCGPVEITGPKTYKAGIKVALGPIRTVFQVSVEVTEEQPPRLAKSITRGEEGGRASSLQANSELRLESMPDGRTQVHYASEVSIFGRLGNFGLGIMKKRASTIGEEFASAFAKRVEAAAEAEERP